MTNHLTKMISEMHLSPFDRFLQHGDQQAFALMVREHLPLVHAVALRLTRDAGLAEDVTQTVFIRLAALSEGLPVGLTLKAWLHRVARSVAIDLIRAESRRRRRENTAAAAFAGDRPEQDGQSFAWERISPMIDEVIARLPAADRELVLSRFFIGCSHAAMATALGLSEDAVRMRLKRAVERMRGMLERRGIVTSAALLALCLPAHAAPAVPGSLQAAVLAAVVPPPVPSGGFARFFGVRQEILIGVGGLAAVAAVLLATLGGSLGRAVGTAASAAGHPPESLGVVSGSLPPPGPSGDDAAAALELKRAMASQAGAAPLQTAPTEDGSEFKNLPAGRQMEVALRLETVLGWTALPS